ncbi:MAG: zinc ribbon domain-containing protein [Promethearchaeota archaeon]
MGLWRVIWTGCLGMLCLVPMAWLSFRFFDLGAAITNGLFIDLGPALDTLFLSFLPSSMGALASLVPILVEGLLGLIMLVFFPLHWALYYRPDEVGFAIAIIIPWILAGTITSALFCKTTKKGFDTGMAIGVGYAIGFGALPFLLQAVIGAATGGAFPVDFISIFNGLFSGLTDLPYLGAVLTATLEGGLIGGIFGAFIGSLKYNPDEEETGGKKSKKKVTEEPTFASSSISRDTSSVSGASGGTLFCPNCGAKVSSNDPFCPNCGAKIN